MPNVSFRVYAPGFVSRFLESHAVMFQGNAGLKPKEGEITSRPWQWPINLRVSLFYHLQQQQGRKSNKMQNHAKFINFLFFLLQNPGTIFLRKCISHLFAWQSDYLVEQFDIFAAVPDHVLYNSYTKATRL